jgi:hypothetical protein
MRFKSSHQWSNLFVCIPNVLIFNVFFYVPYAVVCMCSFLILACFMGRFSESLIFLSFVTNWFSCESKNISAPGLNSVRKFHVPKIRSLFYSRVVVYLPILSEASLRFSQHAFFYAIELPAPRPNPNLEDQGVCFCLGHHL